MQLATGNGIRPTGGLPRPTASNNIRPLKKGMRVTMKDVRTRANNLIRRINRQTARDIADSSRKDARGFVARIGLETASGSMLRGGRRVIQDRARRAAAAAERGSKPAKKALEIYDRQLVPTISDRALKQQGWRLLGVQGDKGKGKNKIVPGPRNTGGMPPKPKKPRKPRKPRKPKS